MRENSTAWLSRPLANIPKRYILRHAQAPLFTPAYMVCRGAKKIQTGAGLRHRRFTAWLSGENAAKAVARVPPRVRAHARLHTFSFGDKDLIDHG